VVVLGAGLILAAGKALRIARTTLCQQLAPRHILGRVNGAYHMVAEGVTPLASMAAGILAKSAGFSTAFALAGALGVAACLYFLASPLNGLAEARAAGGKAEPAGPLGDAPAA
jgi:hypothetical protein